MINNKGLKSYIDIFLNFIYPRNIYCILCQEAIDSTEKYSICQPCRERVPFIVRDCELCGKPLEDLYIPDRCPDCIKNPHLFTRAYSCVEFNDEIKQLVYRLKYGKQRYLSYHMAEIMVEKIKDNLGTIDVIIPVPLHKRKLRDREFNQSQLLAKYIGKALALDVDTKSLIRVKKTISQNKLTRKERKENVKDAFNLVSGEGLRDKNILIVDDVYTTGNTVDACCSELVSTSRAKAFPIYLANN
jgi:competence protein ComFC